MKTIFTLLTSLALSSSLYATDVDLSSTLTVKSNSKNEIKIVMDGKNFEPGFSSVKISNIDAGVHNVTVYQKKTTDLSICDDQYETVYNASLSVEPATQVSITIGRSGRAKVDQQSTLTQQSIAYTSSSSDLNNHSGYNTIIADKDLSYVFQSIQKERLEDNRMISATHIISTNFFTTDQVKQLMQLFNSDDNRLELAKKAYDRTIDQENYKCLLDVLSSNNKIELGKYIRSCQ